MPAKEVVVMPAKEVVVIPAKAGIQLCIPDTHRVIC